MSNARTIIAIACALLIAAPALATITYEWEYLGMTPCSQPSTPCPDEHHTWAWRVDTDETFMTDFCTLHWTANLQHDTSVFHAWSPDYFYAWHDDPRATVGDVVVNTVQHFYGDTVLWPGTHDLILIQTSARASYGMGVTSLDNDLDTFQEINGPLNDGTWLPSPDCREVDDFYAAYHRTLVQPEYDIRYDFDQNGWIQALDKGYYLENNTGHWCSGDVNTNNRVDQQDLGLLLAAYPPNQYDEAADLNGDGEVGTADLSMLLAVYGMGAD